MKQKNNLGEVEDATDNLPQPDFEEDIAQRRFQDDEEETGSGPQIPGKPGDKGKEQPGGAGDKPGEGDDKGDKQDSSNLIGKKVRITGGPDAGRDGVIKQVLANGDIIIE